MIRASTSLGFSSLPRGRRNALDFLSSAPHRWLTENGRTALFQIFRMLPEGEILFPDYHCGVEIETALAAGFKPVFYRIRRDLQPDLDHFEQMIRKEPSAAVVIHFNGFPQPVDAMKAICDRQGVPLVEDCAHVLRTEVEGRALGSFGKFAIFSLRKFAPVPQGGLLVINSPETGRRPSFVPHPLSQTLRDIRVLAHDLVGRRAGVPPMVPKGVHDFRSAAYVYCISPLARWIFERLDLAQARALRRRNYHLLFRQLSCFEELTILFGPESGGVSPAFLMIECADPWRSAAALAARGVESYPFWTFYHQHFPFGHGSDAEYLKSHILALPVHQNLKPEDTHRIIEAVRSALEDPNEREALCIHHHAVSK